MQCAAIHPQDERLATGDATGRIRVYPTFPAAVTATAASKAGPQALSSGADQGPADNLPCTTWHWHAHPVRCLCFSTDGTYLLSGGEEAVLVSLGPIPLHELSVIIASLDLC